MVDAVAVDGDGEVSALRDYKAEFYPETEFGGFSHTDGTVAFYSQVHALLQPSFTVVDFGCGCGLHQEDPIQFRRELRLLKGKVTRVIGVDVDEIAKSNPSVDEFRVLTPGQPWPIADRTVDMIICDYVMEHLPDPREFIQEASRVLLRGGYVCIRTPNANSYFGIAARLIPNRHHAKVISKVQLMRKDEDIFPTLYRCNTISALRRLFAGAGFRAAVYGYEPEPAYLHFSKIAYGLGVAHQRFAPGFLKTIIFAFGELQAD